MISSLNFNPFTHEAAIEDPFRSFEAVLNRASKNGGVISSHDFDIMNHCVEEVVSRSKVPTTVAEEITPSKKSMVIDFTKHLKDLNTKRNGDDYR
ncbi:MAG: hypothetical protein IKO88_00410 [Bacteroidales bacterium]|nr:hypothetical protein [Bacteroidales bacterium]